MVSIDNLDKFADKFKIKSSRLKDWGYSLPGLYFITICTYNHNNFFGKIVNEKIELSKVGEIVNQCLIEIPKHFSNITLDEYVVMPNHVHILIDIETLGFNVETHHGASLQNKTNVSLKINNNLSILNNKNQDFKQLAIKSSQAIPLVIKQFKSSVKRICNQNNLYFGWQTRYYDQIVKTEKEYLVTKQYIKNNPINWKKNKFFNKIDYV